MSNGAPESGDRAAPEAAAEGTDPQVAGLRDEGVLLPHPPGHFYSPICDPRELRQRDAELWPGSPKVPLGIDFDDPGHAELLDGPFARFLPEFDYPDLLDEEAHPGRFYVGNSQFSWLDARALYVLMRHLRPRRIIEVGSGYSSLLMADVNRRFLDGHCHISCVEPYPRAFLSRGIDGIAVLIERKVQDLSPAFFDLLEAGDFLFIDSSHVSKTGSDVNHLYFEVLPRLRPGVLVHIHDIFLPHEYPRVWAVDENRSWNEQYLLRALLMHSTAFRPMFGCAYAWWRFPAKVSAALGLTAGHGYGGGSLWIRRLGEQAREAAAAAVPVRIGTGSPFETEWAYSRAVDDGDYVHVSGTTGFDYATMTIAEDVVAQAEQCFRNIRRALEEAGTGLEDIVRIRYFLPDPGDFSACAAVLRKWLDGIRPAATMLCARLLDPRMRIEIEVTARRRR